MSTNKSRNQRNTNAFKTEQTKKKESERQAEIDAKVPEWDEVNALYHACVATYNSVIQIKDLIRTAVQEHNTNATLCSLAATFLSDMQSQWGELERLHSEHATRTGRSTDENDHMTALSVGASYEAWVSGFSATVVPLAGDISDLITDLITENGEK